MLGQSILCISFAFCMVGKEKIQSCPWSPFAKRATHAWHARNNTTSEQTNNFDGWMLLENLYWMLCSWSNRSDKYYPKLQILQILVTWTALSLILQRDITVNITTCFLLATPRKATTKETFYWPHPGKPRALTDAPTPEVGNWRNERLGCYPDLGCCSYWYLKMIWRKLTLPNHQVTMLQSTLKSVTILFLSEC